GVVEAGIGGGGGGPPAGGGPGGGGEVAGGGGGGGGGPRALGGARPPFSALPPPPPPLRPPGGNPPPRGGGGAGRGARAPARGRRQARPIWRVGAPAATGRVTTPVPSRMPDPSASSGSRVTPSPLSTICTRVGRLVAAKASAWRGWSRPQAASAWSRRQWPSCS